MYLGFDPLENIYWSIFLFILGLILSLKVCAIFKLSYKISIFLYFWHLLFCIIYFWFILSFGGDSLSYYLSGLEGGRDSFLGTGFIVKLTEVLINLGFSFLDCFLLFNLFGYLGLLAFTGAILQATQDKNKYIKLIGIIIILLPSVSFWSSGLGKDSLSFMATTFALWASLDLKSRKNLLFFSIVVMFLVRPHIGFILFFAFAISLIFDKNINVYSKIFLSSLSISVLIAVIPLILKFINLDGGVADVNAFVDKRQSYNLEGGSSVDISSMILPMQMLTYLFRPLPFEANSLFSLLASIDNIILIILFILGIFSILKRERPSVESNRIFLWIYFYLSLIVLATTTANLGIAMRQKWMFIPFMIFLFLSLIGSKNMNFSGRAK